ncbi:MAG: hypothetical protein JNK71_03955 [Methyloversatilis sp.]|uniref:PP0621 family protein n=1 Tax=Methyloversatilis sp. TaxID=2569862 RepID=UPI001A5A2901|nr:PP0621 family protein [Methyloversatilis sp.]MBL8475210.1 hypothetical protein [Methyloversatilis sp.]
MTRILFFALLALVAWLWFFKKTRKPDPVERKSETKAIEQIVQCAHCGLRLPEGEALPAGERHYCSIEHRDAHADAHDDGR